MEWRLVAKMLIIAIQKIKDHICLSNHFLNESFDDKMYIQEPHSRFFFSFETVKRFLCQHRIPR